MVSFSVVIISHGQEEQLQKCLGSLRPACENWQIILVGNGSPIGQANVDFARALTPDVEVVTHAEKQTMGKARNAGIALVKHEWIYFVDESAYLSPKYFEHVVPFLNQERIEILGGPEVFAKAMNGFSQAFAITLGSPFCSGKSFSRHQPKGRSLIPATEEMLTSANLWIRTHLVREVVFAEEYRHKEDTAFLVDLANHGAKMFYYPSLIVARFKEVTLKDVWRDTFDSGFYRSAFMKEKTNAGSFSFWLPALFVLSHLLVFVAPHAAWLFARIYLGLVVMMSLNLAARKQKLPLFLSISFLHYFIVFVYGLGFLSNRLGMKASSGKNPELR